MSTAAFFRGEEEGLFARDIGGRLVPMDPVTAADFERKIRVTIDGRAIEVAKAVPATDAQGNILYDAKGLAIPRPTTIFDAAGLVFASKSEPGQETVLGGISGTVNPIPVLCHREHMDPVAVCRVCVVEVSRIVRGKRRTERKLLPACQHRVEDEMEVQTIESANNRKARERIRSSVKTLLELLMADHPSPCAKQKESADCELECIAARLGIRQSRYPRREALPTDDSSLVIAVDHNACILCDRCVRGCNDLRNNQVIGRMGKGYQARIAFDLDAPMGSSSCVACGECMVSCPTGALTNKAIVQATPWKGIKPPPEPVDHTTLPTHAIPEIRRAFRNVAPAFLEWNSKAIVRRRFKKGEILCNEGEYGATAFFIEKGSVDIYIKSPNKHVFDRSTSGLFGLVRRFTSALLSRGDEPRAEESTRGFIPIDAPVALPYGTLRATLGQGEIVGEMTCMNFYPRSATVRAAEDVTVLEMLRNVLYIMQRSKAFRSQLEQKYRERAIDGHLRSVEVFAGLRDDAERFNSFVARLRDQVKLRRCNPGEIITRQGAPADDGFFLIRTGFVKVSQSLAGGDHVLTYVGPGGYIGEIGLMASLPEIQPLAPMGVRVATCSALDHVDLIQISADDFRAILDEFPEIRQPLVAEAIRRIEQNNDALTQVRDVPLGEFLTQGLMNAQSLLVLDLFKCTRCDECTRACSDTHQGVTRLIREGLRFDRYLVASSCRSCLDPYCMVGCPVGSIRRRESREIIIEDWCIGCGKCAENCPYGNINMHPFPTKEKGPDPDDPKRMLPIVQMKATTCDLCHDFGPNGEPSCVYACPHDAAHRMSGAELLKSVGR